MTPEQRSSKENVILSDDDIENIKMLKYLAKLFPENGIQENSETKPLDTDATIQGQAGATELTGK